MILLGGVLKYYRREIKATGKGDDLKGQVDICGLSIISNGGGKFTLKSPSEKEGRELEFENEEQAEEWVKALHSSVYGTNFEALSKGSRTPEVWSYLDCRALFHGDGMLILFSRLLSGTTGWSPVSLSLPASWIRKSLFL